MADHYYAEIRFDIDETSLLTFNSESNVRAYVRKGYSGNTSASEYAEAESFVRNYNKRLRDVMEKNPDMTRGQAEQAALRKWFEHLRGERIG